MLYFKLYPFTLLKRSRSFTSLFMYLGELLQFYQSSNNLPQSAQTLDFDPKSCFVLLNTSSRSTRCCFGLLKTSNRSARCRLVSVSIFVALVWFAQNLESLQWYLKIVQSITVKYVLYTLFNSLTVVKKVNPHSERTSKIPLNISTDVFRYKECLADNL